jgi:hypothetical protein
LVKNQKVGIFVSQSHQNIWITSAQ